MALPDIVSIKLNWRICECSDSWDATCLGYSRGIFSFGSAGGLSLISFLSASCTEELDMLLLSKIELFREARLPPWRLLMTSFIYSSRSRACSLLTKYSLASPFSYDSMSNRSNSRTLSAGIPAYCPLSSFWPWLPVAGPFL